MKKYDISVLLPARNEEFLVNTVNDILKHSEANTEVIVGLDGRWSDPQLDQHPDVNVVYVPESIGQRAITKMCAKLSKAKYIIKSDSHCAFDQGFDRKMLSAFEKSGDNVVMVPVMKNLHVYDWKCHRCGKKIYQDKNPVCPVCGTDMKKKMVWKPRRGTHSTAYRFDSEGKFEYWSAYKKRPEYKKALEETGLTETMSLQGSFFMMTREKYFDLDIDDEKLGSWGSQGLAVACALWLSGGRVLVNHATFYSHCFRTKRGVFGFPYKQSGNEVSRTKKRVKDLFWNNKWDKAVRPLSFVLDRFAPIPGWSASDVAEQKEREKDGHK